MGQNPWIKAESLGWISSLSQGQVSCKEKAHDCFLERQIVFAEWFTPGPVGRPLPLAKEAKIPAKHRRANTLKAAFILLMNSG